MLFRGHPKYMYKIVRAFNAKQKKAVVEMGFSALLNLNLDYLPGELCYWLATNFKPLPSKLPTFDGSGVHVDENDVHLTLGFPKGSVKIEREKMQSNTTLMVDIATKLKRSRFRVKAEHIETLVLAEVEGGVFFKKLFLLLVEYCFIEAPADGFLRPKILDFIDDVSKVHNYDWCGYVLSVLFQATDKWLKSTGRYYTGPILFLLVRSNNLYLHSHFLFNSS